jgi:hypothetical protein
VKFKLITILYLISCPIFSASESDQGTNLFNQSQTPQGLEKYQAPAADSLFIAPPPSLDLETVPQISVVIEKKSYDCHLDSLSKIYICPNGQSPLLLKYNTYGGFTALRNDKNQQAEIVSVTSAKAGETTLFDNSAFQINFGSFNKPNDLSTDVTKQLFAIDGFLETMNNPLIKPKARTIGSEEYETIVKSYLDKKTELEKTRRTIFREDNFQVELENGKTINCKRGTRRDLTKEEDEWQKSNDQVIQCSAFTCEKMSIDGKDYDASMLYESIPGAFVYPSVHITDANGFGPKVNIRLIRSPNSKKPLVDYSNSLDNPISISYPGMQSIPAPFPESLTNKKYSRYKDPNFDASLQSSKNMCGKDNSAVQNIEKDKENVLNEIANTELVQFITVLSDGSLVGHYVDLNEAVKKGCMYSDVYLNPGAADHLAAVKKNLYPDQHVDSTISLERATELFNKARAMKDIAWDYKQDGCYARAHLMARRFEAEGVRVDKVWIKGDLVVPGTNISWNFHVAPIVYVKDKKGIPQKMVIDPSLFDKPVTVEEWDHKMTKKTIKGSVVTAFPFPENAALVERSVLAFSSSDPYLPGNSINMSEEDKMKKADDTMTDYRGDKKPTPGK